MNTKQGVKGMHTPGPWGYEVIKDDAGIPDEIQVYSDHGEIADINVNQAIGEDERKANANLIAAAPALLEACKAVVKWYEESGSSDPAAGSVELWAACKKAISQAEGGV